MMRPHLLIAVLLTDLAAAGTALAQNQPASDDELMRPTQRSLRFNPVMAHAFMNLWVRHDDVWKDMELSTEQRQQIIDTLGERTMNLARGCSPDVRDGIEYLIETMIEHDGNIKNLGPDQARELAQKVLPLVRKGREWLDSSVEAAEPFLDDQQLRRLQDHAARMGGRVDRLQGRLTDWANGQYKEGEPDPFDELDREELPPDTPQESNLQRRTRQIAEWQVSQQPRWEWARFVKRVATTFKFTKEQRERAEAILSDYRQKAQTIMTPEWKERVLRNRMLYQVQYELQPDVPRGPWLFHLEHEYEEAKRPLDRLTDGLMADVLALVTPEQRAAVLADLRAIAEQHGHVWDELDVEAVGLAPPPATQPAAAP